MELLIQYLEEISSEDIQTEIDDTITFNIGWASYEEHDNTEFVITHVTVTIIKESYSVMTGEFKSTDEYPFTTEDDVIILINNIISDYVE